MYVLLCFNGVNFSNNFFRLELSRQDILTRAIEAAEEELAKAPLREDDGDDETIRGLPVVPNDGVDTSIFDVLSEFRLDLCLSPPTSPTPSTSDLPATTPSPPSSPVLSRSFSFVSQKASTLAIDKSAKNSSSVKNPSTAPARTRGSWPLIKYTGRGTPIDPRRRMEWAGFSTEEVAEDGLLFSTSVRSPSLDSAVRSSEEFLSPESDHAPAHPSPIAKSASFSKRAPSIHEPPPELGPLDIECSSSSKSEEWDSIIKSILASTLQEHPPIEECKNSEGGVVVLEECPPEGAMDFCIMSKEQVEELHTGLETDLGLNDFLDLGLGQRPGSAMKWFDVNLLRPSSVSRCSSPSVYSSQAISPRKRSPAPSQTFDQRSMSSTKADHHGTSNADHKVVSNPWWRSIFTRVRRIQTSLITSKSRMQL